MQQQHAELHESMFSGGICLVTGNVTLRVRNNGKTRFAFGCYVVLHISLYRN